MKNYNHLTVVFFKAAGSAKDDPVLTFQQCTAVDESDIKNLATIDKYWKKEGAALTAIGTFTLVEQTASQTVTLSATSAESQGIYVFEIDGTDLDTENSFDCVKVTVADTGAAGAQLGAMLYILSEPRYAGSTLPSAIVD
ncbi:MAG: hypothetical protein JXM70_07990 [Pirellulales bacterium]|nr:hypothetical protein [Pirellulales bacterium]